MKLRSILIVPSLLDTNFFPHQGKPLVKAELFPHLKPLNSAQSSTFDKSVNTTMSESVLVS